MSADNWLQEYHLTPRGWIEGTSTTFGHTASRVERPSDVVETWTTQPRTEASTSRSPRRSASATVSTGAPGAVRGHRHAPEADVNHVQTSEERFD
jgi:hypothetical protein